MSWGSPSTSASASAEALAFAAASSRVLLGRFLLLADEVSLEGLEPLLSVGEATVVAATFPVDLLLAEAQSQSEDLDTRDKRLELRLELGASLRFAQLLDDLLLPVPDIVLDVPHVLLGVELVAPAEDEVRFAQLQLGVAGVRVA